MNAGEFLEIVKASLPNGFEAELGEDFRGRGQTVVVRNGNKSNAMRVSGWPLEVSKELQIKIAEKIALQLIGTVQEK